MRFWAFTAFSMSAALRSFLGGSGAPASGSAAGAGVGAAVGAGASDILRLLGGGQHSLALRQLGLPPVHLGEVGAKLVGLLQELLHDALRGVVLIITQALPL